jgi:diguanylate cyclase (GGDEF)-like protein
MARILIVDDDETICKLLEDTLRYFEYDAMSITDGRQVLPLLRAESFDTVLVDLLMQPIDGFQLLHDIKQVFEDLPVIIVTGFASIETAVESMQAGAADFITKPVDASELNVRIKRALEHAQTKRLAYTDGLTNLHNYRAFQERLQQEVERANRYHRPLSLIMVDIDHFKVYNDLHGHLQGDAILARVAALLKQVSRSSDIVARYGGEEFALILPETDKASAEILGRRLHAEIEQHRFPGEEHLPHGMLTISVGIASHTPSRTKEELIAAADGVLYQAKREGRNRVCVTA